jgi:hypothetical protein
MGSQKSVLDEVAEVLFQIGELPWEIIIRSLYYYNSTLVKSMKRWVKVSIG